ncbi:MAG: aspartate--tRNA(Asn) ligase, partial [Methanobacteriota archaeon]
MRIPINEVTPETGRAAIRGWVHEIRDLGGLFFCLVRDRTGLIQVTVVKKKAPAAVIEAIRGLNRESVVEAEGTVKAIEKAPGGRELVPDCLTVISSSASPLPLDVVEKVPAELDTRLDARFMDLRRPRVTAVFMIRSAVIQATNEFLFARGFTQITTPKVVAAATEGGTELFPIAYFEREAFLNQSPQLYKQMMMAAGFEKVFEIGPIFRAEEHNTTKHLNEATSIDVEVSFADHQDVMQLLEDLVAHVYAAVADRCSDQIANIGCDRFCVPKRPFPRITYRDAIEIAARKTGEDIVFVFDVATTAEKALGEEVGEHYFIV